MCGIAGIYLPHEAIDFFALQKFTDSLQHRGPDAAGYELFDQNRLGLGHRRLSILDLSELGAQPMHFKEAGLSIVYNGEVFNFEEIKQLLKHKGHQFVSDTDTEVILHAWSEWGPACMDRFNGMWAFALWDEKEKSLYLCRDRFGIKPLYYSTYQEGIAFASETRAFKFLSGFHRKFSEDLLEINQRDVYALEGVGLTPWEGLLQVLPGHYLVVRDAQIGQQNRWWDIRTYIQPGGINPTKQWREGLYALFRDACKMRLVSDVPIATALSGGLDSSSVYCTIQDILGKESIQRTSEQARWAVSAVFPGEEKDEQAFVEQVIQYTQGEVHWVYPALNQLSDQIIKDTELLDAFNSSPITSISSIYAALRNNGITVSLDGHGVDEMMYGYLDNVYQYYYHSLAAGNKSRAEDLSKIISGMYHGAKQDMVANQLEKEIKGTRFFIHKIKSSIKKSKEMPSPSQKEVLEKSPGKTYDFSMFPFPERLLLEEFFVRTLPSLLRNFDRASMMNSIEIRMPFMDWRFVTQVFSIPVSYKLHAGTTKWMLREMMKNKMPESIRRRTFKVGIASPWHTWIQRDAFDLVMGNLIENNITRKQIEKEKKDGIISVNTAQKAWLELNKVLIEK